MVTKKETLTADDITSVVIGSASTDGAYRIIYQAFRGSGYDGGEIICNVRETPDVPLTDNFRDNLGVDDIASEISDGNYVLKFDVDDSSEDDITLYYNTEIIRK